MAALSSTDSTGVAGGMSEPGQQLLAMLLQVTGTYLPCVILQGQGFSLFPWLARNRSTEGA